LIGISGGPDSICLSRVFLKLKEHYALELALLHVNYGLRGEASEDDERFVKEFAKEHGLKLKVVRYKKDEISKERNLEAQMRSFRYQEFEKFAKKEGFDRIALAHNIDDQTETFLMNLFRGSGAKGLSAMKARRERIIRPLLFVSKDEILEWLAQMEQKYQIDKSNFDESFFRNKIRHKLIPILKEYSPQLETRVLQLTENLQAENEIVEEIVEKKYNNIVESENKRYSVLVSDLVALSTGMRKLLFRRIFKSVKGDIKNLSTNNFFEFNKILESNKSKNQKCITNGVLIERKSHRIIFLVK